MTVVAIVLTGVLFAVLGRVRLGGCEGGCGACGATCERRGDHG
ncbi:MAG: hypothetical protein R3E98_08755 [Gemmatimonadota bacterium]